MPVARVLWDPKPNLKENELVRLGETVKPVLMGGKSVLLVTPAVADQEAAWTTLSKSQLKEY
ncbi:MAG TPA: hypothetical protein GXX58_11275 [Gelria sp.]|nr:hypothetical protein [Gelria sp.]